MKRVTNSLFCLLLACGGGTGGDGGPFNPNPFDLDGDGVCDETEARRGLDPANPDTDSDGFDDSLELRLGFDPLMPSSPDRDDFVFLAESENATLTVPINQSVQGTGGDYTGAFEQIPFSAPDGLQSSDFFVGSRVLFADPRENVSSIDEAGEAFRGVAGSTLLGFEVMFVFQDEPLGCARLHPWAYNVKRNDGQLLGARRRFLVVAPSEQTLSTLEFCPRQDNSCF